jgi:lipoate synthase
MDKYELLAITEIAKNDLMETHNLIIHTGERLGWVWQYQTMHEGVRGHFVTVGYLKQPTDSFHTWIKYSKGQTFSEAAVNAAHLAIKDLELT